MKFRYSILNLLQASPDSLPRLKLTLSSENRSTTILGLVDSGATISVLPYDVGLALGETWNQEQAVVPLTGSLGQHHGIPVKFQAVLGNYSAVELVFAWVNTNNVSPILGQMNFFHEFEVTFRRWRMEFEVKPKS